MAYMAYDYGCINGALCSCFYNGIIMFKQLKYIQL